VSPEDDVDRSGDVVVETKAAGFNPDVHVRSNILSCSVYARARCTKELETHIFSPLLERPCDGKEPPWSALADFYNTPRKAQTQQGG